MPRGSRVGGQWKQRADYSTALCYAAARLFAGPAVSQNASAAPLRNRVAVVSRLHAPGHVGDGRCEFDRYLARTLSITQRCTCLCG